MTTKTRQEYDKKLENYRLDQDDRNQRGAFDKAYVDGVSGDSGHYKKTALDIDFIGGSKTHEDFCISLIERKCDSIQNLIKENRDLHKKYVFFIKQKIGEIEDYLNKRRKTYENETDRYKKWLLVYKNKITSQLLYVDCSNEDDQIKLCGDMFSQFLEKSRNATFQTNTIEVYKKLEGDESNIKYDIFNDKTSMGVFQKIVEENKKNLEGEKKKLESNLNLSLNNAPLQRLYNTQLGIVNNRLELIGTDEKRIEEFLKKDQSSETVVKEQTIFKEKEKEQPFVRFINLCKKDKDLKNNFETVLKDNIIGGQDISYYNKYMGHIINGGKIFSFSPKSSMKSRNKLSRKSRRKSAKKLSRKSRRKSSRKSRKKRSKSPRRSR